MTRVGGATSRKNATWRTDRQVPRWAPVKRGEGGPPLLFYTPSHKFSYETEKRPTKPLISKFGQCRISLSRTRKCFWKFLLVDGELETANW